MKDSIVITIFRDNLTYELLNRVTGILYEPKGPMLINGIQYEPMGYIDVVNKVGTLQRTITVKRYERFK